jgi:transcription elongation GreA/GreB family factor
MTLSYIPSDTNDEGIFKANASGSLPNGKPVIVNADGTVSVVSGSTVSSSVGSSAVLDVACEANMNAVYDVGSNRTVFFYRGASNAGKCVVGTVAANNTVSFGSISEFEDGSVDSEVAATYHAAAGKIVVVFRDNGDSGYAKARVGTVDPSDNSISFGTVVTFYSASSRKVNVIYSSAAQKVVVVYSDVPGGSDGLAKVGSVSGTDISFGNQATFESGAVGGTEIGMAYDSNADRVILSYRDQNSSGVGTAIVGAISGTSISFGTKAVFNSSSTYGLSSVYDSVAQKVLLTYRGTGIEALVGTVDPSDNSITYGSSVTVKSDGVETASTVYDVNAKFAVVVYGYAANDSKVALKNGTISGTSVSFGSEIMLDNTSGNSTTIANGPNGSAYDSSLSKIVSSYTTNPNGDGPVGKYVVSQNGYNSTNLTSENYIGISTGGTYASGSNATIKIIGSTSNEQSSLTAGQSYFVQTDGTLGLTADDPSVFAGTAISATKLIVKT